MTIGEIEILAEEIIKILIDKNRDIVKTKNALRMMNGIEGAQFAETVNNKIEQNAKSIIRIARALKSQEAKYL